jgi:hypothetical protein
MSDSLPENPVTGVLKVVKLVTGEELIGLVNDTSPDVITIKLPALLQNYVSKSPTGDIVEFVKLANYVYNIKDFHIAIQRTSVIYSGFPSDDLEKMYQAYITLIQDNPTSVLAHGMPDDIQPENGLQLLNELFNNEDFVGFVNDLIESFEGENIEEEIEDVESFIEPEEVEEARPQPKKKKRKRVKPETNKMPYNPDSPPENPESWSDDPKDYI